jgi:hypothetical protein
MSTRRRERAACPAERPARGRFPSERERPGVQAERHSVAPPGTDNAAQTASGRILLVTLVELSSQVPRPQLVVPFTAKLTRM